MAIFEKDLRKHLNKLHHKTYNLKKIGSMIPNLPSKRLIIIQAFKYFSES